MTSEIDNNELRGFLKVQLEKYNWITLFYESCKAT